MYHTAGYLLAAGLETPTAGGYSVLQLNQVCHLHVETLALQNNLQGEARWKNGHSRAMPVN